MPDVRTNYVIGFGGERGSGKDTVAKLLKQQLEDEGREVTLMGMSDILREAIAILNPRIHVPWTYQFSNEVPGREAVESALHEATNTRIYHYLEVLTTLLELGGLSEDDAYTEIKRIPEVRQFLQELGTEVVRELIDTDAWVKAIQRRIATELYQGRHVLLTGVRFPNELEMVKQFDGGYSGTTHTIAAAVYVERDLDTGDSHASETSLSREDFDIRLDNRGTLEQLKTFTVPALRETLRVLSNTRYGR